MKKMILACITVCSIFCMAGCGEQKTTPAEGQEPTGSEAPVVSDVTYSNLTDEETRKLTMDLLEKAGVSDGRGKVFFDHVDQFNATMEKEWLTTGFETEKSTETKYDLYEVQDAWEKQHGDFLGYNCRITAYGLMGDFISAAPTVELDGEGIEFDLFALEQDNAATPSVQEREMFTALFTIVPTEETKDVTVHAANLQKEWNKRGIAFRENDKMKLISVVLHDQFEKGEDTLLVGHAGVLLPQEDGTLYFLEKVGLQEPYRLNQFQSRSELHNYFMEKYDKSNDEQPTARPFVMENDALMDIEN